MLHLGLEGCAGVVHSVWMDDGIPGMHRTFVKGWVVGEGLAGCDGPLCGVV